MRTSHHKPRIQRLAARDGGWYCWLCDERIDPSLDNTQVHRASADRVIPGRKGGTYRLSNLRLAHQSCNSYRAQHGHANEKPFAPIPRWKL